MAEFQELPQDARPLVLRGDARRAARLLAPGSVDCIVTSPPYWRKRDYGHKAQLGQEDTPQQFARRLASVLHSWAPLLAPHGSVFVNLGDSIRGGRMAGVTTLFEVEAARRGWNLLARIVWAKSHGMPDPHQRLPQRYEFVFHFAPPAASSFTAGSLATPFIDTFAYGQQFEAAEGNVWHITLRPTSHPHLAPFPEELPRRAILLACPERVCQCGRPLRRHLERGLNLDPARPQARRALELWQQHNLGPQHLEAIRATGICDAGKSLSFQAGAERNRPEIMALAKAAKQALGGYFREFTFARPQQIGWIPCECGAENEAETSFRPGRVLDPFMGSGTTLRAAQHLGRHSIGIDLKPMFDDAPK